MKTVSLKCGVCGSSIELTDAAESYIDNQNGKIDPKGRRFLIEIRADEWQEKHQSCIDTRNKAELNRKKPDGRSNR